MKNLINVIKTAIFNCLKFTHFKSKSINYYSNDESTNDILYLNMQVSSYIYSSEIAFFRNKNIKQIAFLSNEYYGIYPGKDCLISINDNTYFTTHNIGKIILVYDLPLWMIEKLIEKENSIEYQLILNLICNNINDLKERSYTVIKEKTQLLFK